MDAVFDAEGYDGVALLKLCVTIDKVALSVADETTEGSVVGQTEFANEFLGDATVFCHLDFCHIGIGNGQRLERRYICLEHHLINMTRGKSFLVDNRTNIKAFCHTDVIGIFHHRNGLSYSHTLGSKAGKDVGFRIFGGCHKGLCETDVFLFQQIDIAPICLQHGHASFVNLFQEDVCQFANALGVGLKHLCRHRFGHILDGVDGSRTSAEKHHMLHLLIPVLTRKRLDLVKVFGHGHKVNEVIGSNTSIPAGNERFAAVLECYDEVGVVGLTEVLEGFVYNLRIFAHLHPKQNETPFFKLPPLAHP